MVKQVYFDIFHKINLHMNYILIMPRLAFNFLPLVNPSKEICYTKHQIIFRKHLLNMLHIISMYRDRLQNY